MPEPPIGSIIAYGGEIDDRWEATNGWYRCDGRRVDPTQFPDLFRAIGFAWGRDGNNFNLPNLQGYFLRGVDLSRDQRIDQDRDSRFAQHGGNHGARVGSFQTWATALPPSPPPGSKDPDTSFHTTKSGTHTHNLFFKLNATRDVADEESDTVVYPGGPETDAPMREAGEHSHGIYGGQSETRPVNAYVHWIIRAV